MHHVVAVLLWPGFLDNLSFLRRSCCHRISHRLVWKFIIFGGETDVGFILSLWEKKRRGDGFSHQNGPIVRLELHEILTRLVGVNSACWFIRRKIPGDRGQGDLQGRNGGTQPTEVCNCLDESDVALQQCYIALNQKKKTSTPASHPSTLIRGNSKESSRALFPALVVTLWTEQKNI